MAKGTGTRVGYSPTCGQAATLGPVRRQSVLGRGVCLVPKPGVGKACGEGTSRKCLRAGRNAVWKMETKAEFSWYTL